jgi:hypothetical protein
MTSLLCCQLYEAEFVFNLINVVILMGNFHRSRPYLFEIVKRVVRIKVRKINSSGKFLAMKGPTRLKCGRGKLFF